MCDTDAKPEEATPGDVEDDGDDVGSQAVGDARSVPEETFDADNKGSDAGSVSKQGAEGETVDSELESKKGEEEEEEDEKTEEKAEKAAADSTSTVKESASVEGDDQKKRFVAFCLLENQNGYLCCIGSFVLEQLDALLEGKLSRAFCVFSVCHSYIDTFCFLAL